MLRKFHTTLDIEKIRIFFFSIFTLMIITETAMRVMICFSYPSKIYAFSLAGLFILYLSLYIVHIKNALKISYAIGIILSFYFITHFIYVIGTYHLKPIMLLWFVVTPIVARIYFSNKISLFIAIVSALSVIMIIKVSALTDLLDHYKEIVVDYYGDPASELILNSFILLIFIYIILASYYLIQVLTIQYPRLTKKNKRIKENEELISLKEETEKKLNDNSIEEDYITETKSIRDVRLQNIYKSVIDYIEKTECYLNPEYTLTQLSKDMKINRITISNSLNGIGGISFKDLLNQYRIDRAKSLFEKNTFQTGSIKQIYTNTGFKYHTTFNRAFKKLEGVTPTEYIIRVKSKL